MKLFKVDRYGWTWVTTHITAAALVKEWEAGNATETIVPVLGRRDLTT